MTSLLRPFVGRFLPRLVTLAMCSVVSSSAQAFERQWHLGGGIGVGAFGLRYASGTGPAVEAAMSYGFTDQFNLVSEVSGLGYGGVAAAAGKTHNLTLTTAAVGITYVFDVLRWIPYAGVLLGAGRIATGPDFGRALSGQNGVSIHPDVVLAGGLDYQLTRDVALGAALRLHMVFASPVTEAFVGTLRAQYTWGF